VIVVGDDGTSGDDGVIDVATLVAEHPITPIPDESAGAPMHYSSGTTGRPKGIGGAIAAAVNDPAQFD
jgi:long-chain acyl-CoA synthetase